MAMHQLHGSDRNPLHGATAVGKADPDERFEISILVRRRAGDALEKHANKLAAGDRAYGRITRERFAETYGAAARDLDAVQAFATAHNLVVVAQHPARRTMVLSGTVAQFCAAFAVQLHRIGHRGGTYRGRTGEIQLPAELDAMSPQRVS